MVKLALSKQLNNSQESNGHVYGTDINCVHHHRNNSVKRKLIFDYNGPLKKSLPTHKNDILDENSLKLATISGPTDSTTTSEKSKVLLTDSLPIENLHPLIYETLSTTELISLLFGSQPLTDPQPCCSTTLSLND